MISFHFNLHRPWKHGDKFDNILIKSWNVFKNKVAELQIYQERQMRSILMISFEYTTNEDHAGLRMEGRLFGVSIAFEILDVRHWNYDKGCWQVYDTN